jgi:hypothetical protein
MGDGFIGHKVCIIFSEVIKMNEKETKVNCHLITRGTKDVETKVNDDLSVSDPELTIGKEIIEKRIKDGNEPENS